MLSIVLLKVLPMIVEHPPHWDRWEHVGRCHQHCGCCLSLRGLIATLKKYGYCDPCYEAWNLTTVCHSWFRTVRRFSNHRWRSARRLPSPIAKFKESEKAMGNAKEIEEAMGDAKGNESGPTKLQGMKARGA